MRPGPAGCRSNQSCHQYGNQNQPTLKYSRPSRFFLSPKSFPECSSKQCTKSGTAFPFPLPPAAPGRGGYAGPLTPTPPPRGLLGLDPPPLLPNPPLPLLPLLPKPPERLVGPRPSEPTPIPPLSPPGRGGSVGGGPLFLSRADTRDTDLAGRFPLTWSCRVALSFGLRCNVRDDDTVGVHLTRTYDSVIALPHPISLLHQKANSITSYGTPPMSHISLYHTENNRPMSTYHTVNLYLPINHKRMCYGRLPCVSAGRGIPR